MTNSSSALRPAGSTRAWRRLRAWVLRRDSFTCYVCGHVGANTVDHVVPRERGGTDDPANLRAAHASCNYRKGARPAGIPEPSRQW